MASEPSVDELLAAASVPFGDLIASIGGGIAEAQEALDQSTLDRVLALLDGDDERTALLRTLGWRPTWYHIPEAEANIQLTLSIDGTASGTTRPKLRVTPVNARNSSRYGFDLQLSSSMRFKIVPIPAPEAAEQLRRVPDLVGLSVSDAESALSTGDLEPSRTGNGARVVGQSPTTGTWVRAGTTVQIELGT